MKLLLIDGSNLIFRAYYATEKNMIFDKDKNPVNAIQTLIPMINKLVTQFKPTHAFIALDSGKSTFRHKMYPEYKGKRSETPQYLKSQFSLALDLYNAMGIKHFATDDYEADDLIATYAVRAKEKGFAVQVVSGDKDLLQLVEKGINVMTPGIGFAKEINYNEDVFFEKFSFLPNRFIEYKALVGDSSDNIIGVQGLGDKTAKKLINQYNTFEKLIEHANLKVEKAKVWQNLGNSIEQVMENLELVTLIKDVEVDLAIDELKFSSFNLENFLPFLQEKGFSKFHTQFAGDNKTRVKNSKIYNFSDLSKSLKSSKELFIVPIYLEQNYLEHNISHIGIRCKGKNFFIDKYDFHSLDVLLKEFNSDVIVYNNKALLSILEPIKGVKFDIYLASSLLNSEYYKKNIDFIGFQYGVNQDANIISNMKKDSNFVNEGCSQILDFIEPLYLNLLSEIEVNDGVSVLNDIELPLSYCLGMMEKVGIEIDVDKLEELKEKYEKEICVIQSELEDLCPINYNSPSQLSVFLFETLGLPSKGIKKTTKSFSTDADNLKKLKSNIEPDEKNVYLIDKLLEYRKIKKILSTYLLGFEKHLKNSKVYPLFNQLAVETGRISITDPNIQNIPIKSDEGKILRSIFDSGKYKYFVSMDYSQVELRVIAHIANEKNMILDFQKGLDIHEETAKKIFDKDVVSSSDRSRAKAINFGIIYGMSPYGLAKQVGISNEQAKYFIEKYFEAYPNIKKYMENSISFALKNEYVVTEFKRRRNIPTIHSKNKMEFEAASRIAINTRIQGTAADIIKLAMIKIAQYIETCKNTVLAMQIHDELVFYTNDLNETENIKKIMEDIVDYEVLLATDMCYGDNWLVVK